LSQERITQRLSQERVEPLEHLDPIPELLQSSFSSGAWEPVVGETNAVRITGAPPRTERRHHRNRAPRARRRSPRHHLAECAIEELEGGVLQLDLGRVRTMEKLHSRRHVLGREPLPPPRQLLLHLSERLIRHEPETDFGGGLGGITVLAALPGEPP